MYRPKLGFAKYPRLYCLFALVMWAGAVAACLHRKTYNSVFALEITNAAALVLMVKLLGQLPLNRLSYLLLFPMTLAMYMQSIPFFLIATLFAVGVCVVLKLQNGYVKGYFLNLTFIELYAALFMYSYGRFFTYFSGFYYEIGRKYHIDPLIKGAIVLLTGVLLLSLFALAAKGLGGIVRRKQELFRRLTRLSAGMEEIVFMLVSLTGVSATFFRKYLDISLVEMGWIVEYSWFFLAFSDAAFICLLLYAVSVKQKMNLIEDEKNVISAYSEDLENSLDHMREIRHDVKNLFLTMGGFVEQSGDERMKEFYRENVVPFMKDAITQSEFHDKLRALEDEPLKSFFFYKLTEKAGYGVRVSLEVCAPVSVGEGYGDIIRVLGILIDNAAEECLLTPEKAMGIRISADSKQTSFRVFNTVRPETRTRGVIEGTTDKGLGRGNGLLIARKIIARYGNLMLNSYFTEEGFNQNLTLIRSRA